MTGAPNQLDAEMQWLAARKNSYSTVAQQVEAVLRCSKLAIVLGVLEKGNRTRERPFLLSVHLFQIVHSVEERGRSIKEMPVLRSPPSGGTRPLSSGFQESRVLAKQLRKGPQPKIALAARIHPAHEFPLFAPVIRARETETEYVPLSDLLNRAAKSLDFIAKSVVPADQHRRRAKDRDEATRRELRTRAMRIPHERVRGALGRPHHEQVAAIAAVLSGIETSTEDVKKVDRRGLISAAKGQKTLLILSIPSPDISSTFVIPPRSWARKRIRLLEQI